MLMSALRSLMESWRNCNNKQGIITGIVVGTIIITLFGCLIYHLVPKNNPGTVASVSWNTSTHLLQKTKYHAEEWGEPYGKDIVPGTKRCESRYYGQRKCFCSSHESCYGSGR